MHSIKTGSVALDDVLPTIQSELEAIGFYDMLAKVQEELDAYLAQQYIRELFWSSIRRENRQPDKGFEK